MVPHEDVAVESGISGFVHGAPIVVVGGTSVVGLAVAQVGSYTYYKYGAIFFSHDGLSLLGGEIGVFAGEVLGIDECDVLRKCRGLLGSVRTRAPRPCGWLRKSY